jgi:hypothetical protein
MRSVFFAEGSQFLISGCLLLELSGERQAAAVFGFVHLCARMAERHSGHEFRRIGEAAQRSDTWRAAERTNSLFGLRMRILDGAIWFLVMSVSDDRLERLTRGFADRSQFFLSSNNLLGLCGASVPVENFRLCGIVHGLRKICTLHKAARPTTGREEMKEAQEGGLRARSTPGPVSRLSVPAADLSISWWAISWYASFCGAARSAGEAVKTSNVGKWHSSNFKKVAQATDRRHTLAVLLSH